MSILEVNALKKIYTSRSGGNQVQALLMSAFRLKKVNMLQLWVSQAPERLLF